MTKEEAWEEFEARYCYEDDAFHRQALDFGYDACLNRVCKWKIKVDKYTGIEWRYPECAKGNMKTGKANGKYCQYCGGKIEEEPDIPLCDVCGCAGNESCGHEPIKGDCALDAAGVCGCCRAKEEAS
jgi:hypothetical protein